VRHRPVFGIFAYEKDVNVNESRIRVLEANRILVEIAGSVAVPIPHNVEPEELLRILS
jgi:hypothetical protein